MKSTEMTTEIERAGARHKRRLTVALLLVVTCAVVQLVVALATSSLSPLSDAGHMGTDSLGLAMALAAIATASRAQRKDNRTFGLYRLEILAAPIRFFYSGLRLLRSMKELFGSPNPSSLSLFLCSLLLLEG